MGSFETLNVECVYQQSEDIHTRTDFVTYGIQANSLKFLEGYCAPIICVGFVYTIIVFHVFSWQYLICYGKFYLFL